MKRMTFEKMWEDILRRFRERDEVRTLADGVRNQIVKVKENRIVVRSEHGKNDRVLRKESFRPYYTALVERGSVDSRHHAGILDKDWIGVGLIIMAIIAQLPYVEYQTGPVMIFLKK